MSKFFEKDGQKLPALFMHPRVENPTELQVNLGSENIKSMRAFYGMDPSVINKTDGVVFYLDLINDWGMRENVFEDYFNPKQNETYRKLFLDIDNFGQTNKAVIMGVKNLEGSSSDHDWSYWVDPKIDIILE